MATLTSLAQFQAQFLTALQAPLTVRQGRLTSEPQLERGLLDSLRDAAHLPASGAFSVYHRQYWFRLFEVVQKGYPLLAGLLGLFECNLIALDFFKAHPPRGDTLHGLTGAFGEFAVARSPLADREPLTEAAAIDRAVNHALLAPPATPSAHLTWGPSWSLVVESWPLLALRREVIATAREARSALPPKLLRPQLWAVGAHQGLVATLQLEPTQHRLYELLGEHDLEGALGQLEAEVAPSEQLSLPARVERWLSLARRYGLVSGSMATSSR